MYSAKLQDLQTFKISLPVICNLHVYVYKFIIISAIFGSILVKQCVLLNGVMAASWHFEIVCEEDLD